MSEKHVNGGRKLTPDKREEVVRRYMAGESARKVALEFGISRSNIDALMKSRDLKKGWIKLRPEQKEEIKNRYVNGESSVSLGKEFGVTHNSINGIIRRRGIKIRTWHEAHKTLPLNHNAFSEITPESAYWIGFLITDGCIQGNNVVLQLAEKDKDHVYKFKKFLKSEHKIIKIPPRMENSKPGVKNSTAAYRFCASSKQMVSDLAKYGVIPKKSLIAEARGEIKFNRDFWRGVVDGDGSVVINKKGYPVIQMTSGSVKFIEQFRKFCTKTANCPSNNMHRGANVYIYAVHGTNACRLADVLYNGACEFLERKKDNAMKAMSYIPKINQWTKSHHSKTPCEASEA